MFFSICHALPHEVCPINNTLSISVCQVLTLTNSTTLYYDQGLYSTEREYFANGMFHSFKLVSLAKVQQGIYIRRAEGENWIFSAIASMSEGVADCDTGPVINPRTESVSLMKPKKHSYCVAILGVHPG